MERAILILGDTVSDISGKVQMIFAKDKETGEVKYRGNGINVYRFLHKDGNLPLFLAREGVTVLFGEKVIMYTPALNWTTIQYDQYDMEASDPQNDTSINVTKLNDIVPGIF